MNIEQKARERARRIVAWVKDGTPLDKVAEAHLADILQDDIQSAVLEEREECAKTIERDRKVQGLAHVHLAALIRARSQKAKETA